MKDYRYLLVPAVAVLFACTPKEVETELPEVQPQVVYAVTENTMSVPVDAGIEFSARITSEGPVSCEWKVNDNVVATTPTFVYVFNHVGQYKVDFRAFNKAGSAEKTYTVTVEGIPLEITFTPEGSTVNCVMLEDIIFKADVTAGSKGVEHKWSVDGEEAGTDAAFTFHVPAAGEYTVTYYGHNYDEFELSHTWTVIADELPLDISLSNPDATITCAEGTEITLSANVLNGGRGIVHSWKLDGVEISTEASMSHTFDTPGEYGISYNAKNGKGETFSHTWAVTVTELNTEITHMYMNFEDGVTPSNISGNNVGGAPAWSVVPNPYPTATNPSSYVLVDNMHTATWGTSGYMDIKNISVDGKANSTILRIKAYQGANAYFPYMDIFINGQQRKLPNKVNGVEITDSSAAVYSGLLKTDDWNILEYYASSVGAENFGGLNQIQLRPFSLWGGGSSGATPNDTDNTKVVWFDDIEFVE